MGNLLLTALFNITGNLTESLESLSKILNIKGRILPFTEDKPILMAYTKDGVHPTLDGYKVMEALIKKAIDKVK